jgi:hypothetical protein
MLSEKDWRCKICDEDHQYGIVDTIALHVKGGKYTKAMRAISTTKGNQSTIQAWITKGIVSRILCSLYK